MNTITLSNVNQEPDTIEDWFDAFLGPSKFEFLSNFHPAPVTIDGITFPTSEHAFAYAKVDQQAADANEWQALIANATSPGQAKALGRTCPLRTDWEAVKFNTMKRIVWAKFTQNPHLTTALLNTGHAYLQEGTLWDDLVWGVDLTASNNPWDRPGHNWLGTILMEIRSRLEAMNWRA